MYQNTPPPKLQTDKLNTQFSVHDKRAARMLINSWREDWCKFAKEALDCNLDKQQQEILRAVQNNPKVTVASGTARGKDYVAAVAALCFLYLTPRWSYSKGKLIENTKVALTAPTDRQVKNIMMPEIARLYNAAIKKGLYIGKLNKYDIRTNNPEWFLAGFKADEHNHEAWTGFHAVNTMFVVTEASGISETIWNAIEGNLQGNSRLLIVFNPNRPTGFAAKSQSEAGWAKFRLNSLDAPNVIQKKNIIPGQVDYEWVTDKIQRWCTEVKKEDVRIEFDDFEFEGKWYRPEDLFRTKVLGKFPKVGEDMLIPKQWIELANENWQSTVGAINREPLRLGVDVAGMGRDNTVFCHRKGNRVLKFDKSNSGGKASHMKTTGEIAAILKADPQAKASIDTIGEGAGVYSRLIELGLDSQAFSCKYSQSAKGFRDITNVYEFANMRAYLFWAVRDWLDPKNNFGAALPPDDVLMEEAVNIKWEFQSSGKIMIESKDAIKQRIGRSTDKFDALANTFYSAMLSDTQDLGGMFF